MTPSLPRLLPVLALLVIADASGTVAAQSRAPELDAELWIGGAAMMTVPLYFVLQAWFAFTWTGGWRVAALGPLLGIVPAVAWSLHALSHGSNLWPITVILLAPFGFVYLVLLGAARFVARRFAALAS
jgi:hypothetical protein